MRNVHLHLDDQIVLDIDNLLGEMVSVTPGQLVNFDDSKSYVVRVASARVSMDMTSLTAVLNTQVFGYDGAPLTNIQVEALPDGRLQQRATLHKGVAVPVVIVTSQAVTPDGRLRMHIESMKAAGIPVKGFLALFGLSAEKLMSLKGRPGVQLSANDIDITPGNVLPPPRMTGRLSHVEVQNGRLLQVLGDPARGRGSIGPSDSGARNYIYFKGSSLRFGKLTMTGTDLQLIDQDPRDPFDFYPARYSTQLVAGYSKNTPSGGLRTYMPDFAKIGARSRGGR
jgi:hypothetical protein